MNCNSGIAPRDTPSLDPLKAVTVAPGELMFYGELGTMPAMPKKLVTVTNGTERPVVLTSSYIVDDTQSRYGSGAARYFEIDGNGEEIELRPGQTTELAVSFSPTADLKEALLVIETTDESSDALVVDLSGKFFSGETGF